MGFLIPINLVQYSNKPLTIILHVVSGKNSSKMAANYTASTITIFLNFVGIYFWRLHSFLIQRNYTASKNSTSMFHVVTGNAKNMII